MSWSGAFGCSGPSSPARASASASTPASMSMSRRSTRPSVYRASTSPGSSSIRSSVMARWTGAQRRAARALQAQHGPSGGAHQRRQVPGVRVRERAVVGVEHGVDAGDDAGRRRARGPRRRGARARRPVAGRAGRTPARRSAAAPSRRRPARRAPSRRPGRARCGRRRARSRRTSRRRPACPRRPRGSTSRAAAPRPRRRRRGAGRAAARRRSCARGRPPRPRRRPRDQRPLGLALHGDVLVAPADEHGRPVGVPLDLGDGAEDAHLAVRQHVPLLVVDGLARRGRTLERAPDASPIVRVDPLGDDALRAARSRELLRGHLQLARQLLGALIAPVSTSISQLPTRPGAGPRRAGAGWPRSSRRLRRDPLELEVGLHPGQQLPAGERLDQVVVGAGLEALDRRLLTGARRHQHDRDAGGERVLAQGMQAGRTRRAAAS